MLRDVFDDLRRLHAKIIYASAALQIEKIMTHIDYLPIINYQDPENDNITRLRKAIQYIDVASLHFLIENRAEFTSESTDEAPLDVAQGKF